MEVTRLEKIMYSEITKDDLQAMSQLFMEVFNEAPWNDKWTIETAYKRLEMFYNSPGFDGLLQYEEGKLVALILGIAEAYFDGTSFRIIEFCVDNHQQRSGYGSKLLAAFKERLKQKGMKDIFLLTCRGESTEGFYQKNGFNTSKSMIMMHTNL